MSLRRRTIVLLVLMAATVPAGAAAPPAATRLEKLGRILLLEDKRTLGNGELERYLRDADRGLRRRAALAAGRVGDPAALPSLMDLLNDGEREVRHMAAFALGLIGDKAAVDRLLAALKDSDTTVRARVAEALGRIGDPRAAPAVARLVEESLPKGAPLVTVRGDDPGSRDDPWLEPRLGLFALVRLKDARAAESVLVAGVRSRFDWWAATWAAMRLEMPGLRPVLVAAATSSDSLSRAFAARGLGALKDASALDALVSLAADKDETVAVNALRALARIPDPRGTRAATLALKSPRVTLQTEALKALVDLPADAGLRATLVSFVGAAQPAVRAAALGALAKVDREQFALVLSGLDRDPSWMVRAAIATALGEAGDEISLGILFSMLKDDDPRVLPAVLEALQKARGPNAADTLRRHLEHPDPVVRAAAAEGLAELKTPGSAEAVAAAYRRARSEPEMEARLGLVDALKALDDDAARAALQEAAASDPARPVRERALAALKAKGGTGPAPGPDDVDRPALDYREAMAPYDPRPGHALFSPRALVHTRRGTIEIHLDVVETPLTTATFVDLARRGYFDGLSFHRVVPGFVVQGGDPRGDGSGGPGYALRNEDSERPYGRGAVGLALAGKDTGGSQFFITHVPTPHLDGAYPLFGQVARGMEVVDQIQAGDVIERIEIWTGP